MTSPATAAVPEINVQEAARRVVSGKAVLIDVREPDEWELGRAPQASHLPLSTLQPGQLWEAAGLPVVVDGGAPGVVK